ncbi:hypothetical protein ASPZODRAFT_131575 [Penicilliopsis zonata CBS 506.65]|uniref:Vps72/YL1 C-terminal domain-containing protein n=1 Tax=Penicilliopsis zonata CBS 506.65 TaxID=1073090 RepID=A0A1L9SL84_9EURO|nr:hypothetical protein ASPZODRAFT_131575 [Penicilliopsis zonata CBS 506.65]OJJ47955.1 hypothetical protein ASPZODRAFT_131575 [Penicilliopsis zonata CBS 506.65]
MEDKMTEDTVSSGVQSSTEDNVDPVETLVGGRAKRATAGKNMGALLDAEADDDLALLFEEVEDDNDFSMEEGGGDQEDDMGMDSSSSDEEDQGPNVQADDLEGERELEKQAKEDRKKRKATENLRLTALRKKVKIDPTAIPATAPQQPPRPKKKSERISWLPTVDDGPTRSSSRRQTMQNKELTHARLQASEKKRIRLIATMEEAAKRKAAHKPKQMTQAQRLAEAERVERVNSKTLNRWEEMERKKAAERKAKIEALQNRRLEGPVMTYWSGVATWVDGTLKRVGKADITPKADKDDASRKKKKGDNEEKGADGNTIAEQKPDAVSELQGDATATAPTVQGHESKPSETAAEVQPTEKAVEGNAAETAEMTAEKTAEKTEETAEKRTEETPEKTTEEAAEKAEKTEKTAEQNPQISQVPGETLPENGAVQQESSTTEQDEPFGEASQPAATSTSVNMTPKETTSPKEGQMPSEDKGAKEPLSQNEDPPRPLTESSAPPMTPTRTPSFSIIVPPPSRGPKHTEGDKMEMDEDKSAKDQGAIDAMDTTPDAGQEQPKLSDQPSAEGIEPVTGPVEDAVAGPAEKVENIQEPTPAPTDATAVVPVEPTAATTAETADVPAGPPAPPVIEKTGRNLTVLENFDDKTAQSKEFSIYFNAKKPPRLTKISSSLCVITSQPSRYKHTTTALPFANAHAYREIRRTAEQKYAWSTMLGCYVGPVGIAARGVPERFLDPTATGPEKAGNALPATVSATVSVPADAVEVDKS